MNSMNLGLVFLLVSALLYGPQNPLVKVSFPLFGPVNLMFLVFLSSAVIFFIFYIVKFKKLPKIEKNDIPIILLIGIFSGIAPLLYFYSLNFTEVKNVTFIAAVSSVMINVVIGRKFLDEDIDIYLIVGGILSVVGSLLISTNGLMSLPSIGDLMIILGIFVDSVRNMLTKKYFKKRPIHEGIFFQIVGAGITLGVLLFPFISPSNFTFTPITVFTIFYMSFISIIIGKIFFLKALDKIGLSKSTLFFNVFLPISISLFALIIIRETFNNSDFIGASISLVGITIINWERISNRNNNNL